MNRIIPSTECTRPVRVHAEPERRQRIQRRHLARGKYSPSTSRK